MNTPHLFRICKCLFCFLMVVFVQTTAQVATTKPTSIYDEKWKQVADFIKADRPESALEVVAAIDKQARAENNSVQQIKASVMRIKLIVQKDPDQLSAQLAGMEALIAGSTDETVTAILRSITAEFYLNYYRRNTYVINKRTAIKGQVPSRFTEWTGNIFSDTIRTLLAQSLQPAERLQSTPIETIRDLFAKLDVAIEPSVYDVLAMRRITLLNSLREAQSDRDLNMEPTPLFAAAERFITLQVADPNVTAIENEIIGTFQQWLQFRLHNGNAKAYLHTDVYRLQTLYTMVYPQTYSDLAPTLPLTAQQLYLRTLQELSIRYADNELVLNVLWAQAQFYRAFYTEGDPLRKDYKYKALMLANKGLSRFPRSSYNINLRTLQFELTVAGINLTNKAVVMRNTPLEVVVRASNTSKAELTLYRVNLTPTEFFKLKNSRDIVAMANCTVLERRIVTFNKDTLLNPVDTTLIIQGLDYGQYGYSLRIPGNSGRIANAYFVVSDMASIAKFNEPEVCVVDRVTGKPYADVKVQGFSRPDNSFRVDAFETPVASGKTNKDGFFTYTGAGSSNYVFFYERGADCYLTSQQNVYINFRETSLRDNRQLSLLTDRSLYRPGQTVYFKGIAYEISKDVQRVLPNQTYTVELFDANNQSVAKKSFTTNEFG